MRIQLSKTVSVPDPIKLARYEKAPELGPRILFFSGGSALRTTSHELTRYSHNSTHLITPFDSGGSSAKLRKAFNMPAIGDIRNRLMALADKSLHGNPEVYRLFSHRFPKNEDNQVLQKELLHLSKGKSYLVAQIPDPMRKIIRNHLDCFQNFMPDDFDLRGASIGNLILTAGYLNNRMLIDPVIYIFTKLVEARGMVRPILNQNLHLVAELEDQTLLVGQHNLTGKETKPIKSKVKQIYLSASEQNPIPIEKAIRDKVSSYIQQAELICYPIGSFYSSLIANLLPRGVGRAIYNNSCPKVFIPNTGHDPELYAHSLMDQVENLLFYLQKDFSSPVPDRDLLRFILVDRKKGQYPGKLDEDKLVQKGIQVLDLSLISSDSTPLLDPVLLTQTLLSLT